MSAVAERSKRERAIAMRDDGMTIGEVAEALGCSKSNVRYMTDANYREQTLRLSREAKRRRAGICRSCGGVTRYGGGKENPVSPVCIKCAADEYRKWDEGAIIAAIRRWAAAHGRQPVSSEWLISSTDNEGYPDVSCIQAVFGSWNAAIEAAGYEPLPVGHRTPEGDERMRLARLKWSQGAIVDEIRERYALDGVACSIAIVPTPIRVAAIREFGSWERACLSAGVNPRGGSYRDRSCVCGFGPTTSRGMHGHGKVCKG